MAQLKYLSLLLIFLVPKPSIAQSFGKEEIKNWQKQANNITITRDIWGIPHINGKSDADAVFGLMYAQCEDDFNRVELNFIERLGRKAEITGSKDLYNDLYFKILLKQNEAKQEYKNAAPWLKKLLDAHAAGINYYLYKHPTIKPKLLTRFEPWFHLIWTDGSIGAISTADLTVADLAEFYGGEKLQSSIEAQTDYEQTGSNGFAIAPQKSKSGHALLYLNPHTSLYFRPEVHVKSEEGLNAYGAVTWGQMFVYQGFNEYNGWMHTSSNADVADTYLEKVSKVNKMWMYEYDGRILPVKEQIESLKYLKNGQLKEKKIKVFATHHGPVFKEKNNKWISLKHFNRSLAALEQSWLRTKTKGLADYTMVMEKRGNTSNNTVFADNKGNIAYWHGNYMPKRDPKLNWALAQDGSLKSTEYQGLHLSTETVQSINPPNGWLQNCNSTVYSCAGVNSPKKENYPDYMAPDGENFRGIHAVSLLAKADKLDLDGLIALGHSNYITAFEILLPTLVDRTIPAQYQHLKPIIDTLTQWDYRINEHSIAATVAIEWAESLGKDVSTVYIDQGELDQVKRSAKFAKEAPNELIFRRLDETVSKLNNLYGHWAQPWGKINRFQRINNEIPTVVHDSLPSLPLKYASALWGSLASYNTRRFNGSKNRYVHNGNSFVAAVEFGPKIKAKSILAGGNSGDPKSPYFNNQGEMYTKGQFKDVLFYEEDINKNTISKYKPGMEKLK